MSARLAGVRAWWQYTVWLPACRSPALRWIHGPIRTAIWRRRYRRDPAGTITRAAEDAVRQLAGIARLQQLTADRSPLCRPCSTPRPHPNHEEEDPR
ncbi:hypothetical protein ACWCXH_33725 [Kitasatospora sp. NPDC001660]